MKLWEIRREELLCNLKLVLHDYLKILIHWFEPAIEDMFESLTMIIANLAIFKILVPNFAKEQNFEYLLSLFCEHEVFPDNFTNFIKFLIIHSFSEILLMQPNTVRVPCLTIRKYK